MNHKYVVPIAVLLIVLISITLFLTLKPPKQIQTRTFYVGVDYGYGTDFSQLKALVDKVKDYTNLIVVGSVLLSFNKTALDESCDYIYDSGLSFIVLFTTFTEYIVGGFSRNYTIFDWATQAEQKYGNKFLGIYRFDEPGGNQLDDGKYMLINDTALNYAQVAQDYVGILSVLVHYYATLANTTSEPVLKIYTSDYGLYWFDYQAGYSTIFAEFVGNESRQRIIALDRGAAQSFNRPWGVIVTWKYDQPPYLESATELYSDLSLAYSAGATYAIVYSYPNITTSDYGTLTQDDFNALQKFWNDIHTNPGQYGSNSAEAAFVIPADFGFGFRSATDTIWGLFPADNYTLTPTIWNDTQILIADYHNRLNIVYDDPEIIGSTLNNYTRVFYYNQTIK